MYHLRSQSSAQIRTFLLGPEEIWDLINLTSTSFNGLMGPHKYYFIYCCCCSVSKSCLTCWDPMDCSMPGLPVPHHLQEFAQVHVHWIGDAIQSSNLLFPLSPPALNLSQHQGIFRWVGCLLQVVKVLELQLQNRSFQWVFRVDFFYRPCSIHVDNLHIFKPADLVKIIFLSFATSTGLKNLLFWVTQLFRICSICS